MTLKTFEVSNSSSNLLNVFERFQNLKKEEGGTVRGGSVAVTWDIQKLFTASKTSTYGMLIPKIFSSEISAIIEISINSALHTIIEYQIFCVISPIVETNLGKIYFGFYFQCNKHNIYSRCPHEASLNQSICTGFLTSAIPIPHNVLCAQRSSVAAHPLLLSRMKKSITSIKIKQ